MVHMPGSNPLIRRGFWERYSDSCLLLLPVGSCKSRSIVYTAGLRCLSMFAWMFNALTSVFADTPRAHIMDFERLVGWLNIRQVNSCTIKYNHHLLVVAA